MSNSPDSPQHSERRILIIDDDALVAKSLARSMRGTDTTVVGGGEEALALLQKDQSFNVIFCDLMMPGLSGPQLYEKLGESHPQLQARVVFITGGVFSDRIQDFLDQRKVRCLYKPFSRNTVLETIEKVEADLSA